MTFSSITSFSVSASNSLSDIRDALYKHRLSYVTLSNATGAPSAAFTDETVRLLLADNVPLTVTAEKLASEYNAATPIHDVKRESDAPLPNAAFIMAGGFGTRLRPLTDSCPKPMLDVGGKPMLEIIVDNFIAAGIRRFYVSTHYLPEVIRNHFKDGKAKNVSIDYIHESEPLGTGGALGLLPQNEIKESLIVMNGDVLTDMNFRAFLRAHERSGAKATVAAAAHSHTVPYGVLEHNNGAITGMVEKPTRREYVNAGIYALHPDAVKSVKKGERIDLPTVTAQYMESGGARVFPLYESWLDIGHIEDYRRAQGLVGAA